MDYEGKYFPDEEDERTSRPVKRTKKILHYIFYTIVAVVYVIVFAVLLNNCEPKMYKKYVFSQKANELYEASPDDFMVYEFFPKKFMSDDGRIQIAGAAYAEAASEIELGIKYNKKLNDPETGKAPEFVLKDTNGNLYPICNTVVKNKGRYCYMRLSFSEVAFSLDENVYINEEASAAAEGESEMFDSFGYFLEIHSADEEPVKITVYNNVTPIQLTEFK